MAESAGGDIGLQDVKNGKKRLENLDGLNDQIRWNRDHLNGRIKAIFCTLLTFSVAFSWVTGMPILFKYGVTLFVFASLVIYFLLKFIRHKKQSKLRSEHINELRKGSR